MFQAYCHTFVVRTFCDTVTNADVDKHTKDVLIVLCKLYAVHGIVENLGEFIQVCNVRMHQGVSLIPIVFFLFIHDIAVTLIRKNQCDVQSNVSCCRMDS